MNESTVNVKYLMIKYMGKCVVKIVVKSNTFYKHITEQKSHQRFLSSIGQSNPHHPPTYQQPSNHQYRHCTV